MLPTQLKISKLVTHWFKDQFDAVTEVQSLSWPKISHGKNVLISAPTGSGKTLSAFLVCLDKLIKESQSGTLDDACQVLYISPLKALSNDIEKNLNKPLEEMQTLAEELNLPIPQISVGLRTGDTPTSKRQAMLKSPPHVLVTTPESLYLLLTSQGGRGLLKSIKTVIIDEIHALAGNKRGSHLSLSLERLEEVCENSFQRIGLSATQNPLEDVANFLVGGTCDLPRSCDIVSVSSSRNPEVDILIPKIPLSAVCSHEAWDEVLLQLSQEIKAHNSTLIFVNTRRMAERISFLLKDYFDEDLVSCHHGSLSKDLRLEAESKLKEGKLKALVATASLELGIDIGAIDLVCQIGSPRYIATFLQRIGRARHQVGAVPKAKIFALTQDELIESIALIDAVQNKVLDEIEIPQEPMDILAQHIIAETSQQEVQRLSLYATIRRAYPYRHLSLEKFDNLLKTLRDGFGRDMRERALVLHDAITDNISGKGAAKLTSLMNGGAIPELGDFPVVLEAENIKIGTVSEDFALESSRGDIFTLGTHSWQITKVRSGTVFVNDVGDAPPTIPVWFGEAPGRSYELSLNVGKVRREIAEFLDEIDLTGLFSDRDDDIINVYRNPPPVYKKIADYLNETYNLKKYPAIQAIHYITAQKLAMNLIPDENNVVYERFFDESGGMQLVVHSCFGTRVNRALGLAKRKRFCRSFNFELQASADDNGFVLSLGPQHSFPIDSLYKMVSPDNIKPALRQAILPLPMFETRWRWNCNRSLAVPRMMNGKKVPPALQRFKADDLLTKIFPEQTGCQENLTGDLPIPDHVLVEQTIIDCMIEAMDVERAIRLLNSYRNNHIQYHAVESREPSPFSQSLLNMRPYAFLDDAPLEERRTQSVPQRRGLSPKQTQNINAINPIALEHLRKSIWPRPQSTNQLYDIVTDFVWLDLSLCHSWTDLVRPLLSQKRVFIFEVAENRYLATGENYFLVKNVYPDLDIDFNESALPSWVQDSAPNRELAIAKLVKGYLKFFGPQDINALIRQTKLDKLSIQSALYTLESKGDVLRGAFDVQNSEDIWGLKHHIFKLQRATVEMMRPPIKSMEFSKYWSALLDSLLKKSKATYENLYYQLGLLQGSAIPLKVWESDILPSRIDAYNETLLDQLCLSGDVMWFRYPSNAQGDSEKSLSGLSEISKVTIIQRRYFDFIFPQDTELTPPTLPPKLELLYEVFLKKKSVFFNELRDHLGLLNSELRENLLKLVQLGLIHSDSFAPLRDVYKLKKRKRHQLMIKNRFSLDAQLGLQGSPWGRWTLLETNAETPSIEDIVEFWAELLLTRWGIVFFSNFKLINCPVSWGQLRSYFKQKESQGLVYSGYFIKGIEGEQFCQKDFYQHLQKSEKIKKPTLHIVHGRDPLNISKVDPSANPIKQDGRLAILNGTIVGYSNKQEVTLLQDFGLQTNHIERQLLMQGNYYLKTNTL